MDRRVRGLLGGDPIGYARAHGAEVVLFEAERGGTAKVRDHVRAALAMEGHTDGLTLAVETLLRRARLANVADTRLELLTPLARYSVALVEVAAGAVFEPLRVPVVVPEPPLPWPIRHELRLVALSLFGAGDVVLHAYELEELLPLMKEDAIETMDGLRATAGDGNTLLVRLFATGAPYEAFVAALKASRVKLEGGPIAHRLEVPYGFTARDVLAIAHETEVDVLEVRPAPRPAAAAGPQDPFDELEGQAGSDARSVP